MERLSVDNSVFFPLVVELVSEGYLVTIVARGNSMRPFIEDGRDKLVFGPVDAFSVGDVILAEVGKGNFVCHRVVRIENGMVTMRGDGNVERTERFPLSAVRVKLVQVVRRGSVHTLATSRVWRCYSAVWTGLLPMRRCLLWGYRFWHRVCRICLYHKKREVGVGESRDILDIKTKKKMKIKNGFEMRNVCGEHIVIAHGVENIDFTKIITLNETAAFLWSKAKDGDFTASELVAALLDEYDVTEVIAREDVRNLLVSWMEAGVLQNTDEDTLFCRK